MGFAYIHSAVDDHSRLAYSEVLADETGATSAAFWRRAEAFFRAHGIVVERVMTDNAFAYRGRLFNEALAERRILHRYCRPYRPQTNGRVERFNRTLLAKRSGPTSAPTPARWPGPGRLTAGYIATTITGCTPQSEVRPFPA